MTKLNSVLQIVSPYVILVTLLWALAACTIGPQAGAATTVRFMVFGDPAERDAYVELVDSFHAAHPEIRVALTHIPSMLDYRVRLVTEFAAGSPPDVSLMNYRRFAGFAAKDMLEPLGPYLDRSEVIAESDFYPVTTEAFYWEGVLTCVPQNISSLVVFYNEALFDAAGLPYPADDWDWDNFLETAKALTRDVDGDGRIDQYGLGVEPSLFRLAPFVWQNGGPVVDNTEQPRRLTITRPPSLEALEWFVALYQEHGVVPGRVEETALDSESRFVAGTTAMFLNSRRGTPTYREIDAFTWDIAPLPRGKEEAGILHSDGYCLSATAQDKEAAWTFIEYANSVEGQTIVAHSGRTVPSLIEVAGSDVFLEPGAPPARSRVFIDTIPLLRRVPVMSTWEEVEKVASAEIERAFYGDVTPEEAAITAVQRTEEYFIMAHYASGR